MVNPLLSMHTPGEAGQALAERAKSLRLLKAYTRASLARRAGVSPASLKRFEATGAASLDLVLRIAFALGRLEDFMEALQPPVAATLAELQASHEQPRRKRGNR